MFLTSRSTYTSSQWKRWSIYKLPSIINGGVRKCAPNHQSQNKLLKLIIVTIVFETTIGNHGDDWGFSDFRTEISTDSQFQGLHGCHIRLTPGARAVWPRESPSLPLVSTSSAGLPGHIWYHSDFLHRARFLEAEDVSSPFLVTDSVKTFQEGHGYGSKLGTPIIGWLILN